MRSYFLLGVRRKGLRISVLRPLFRRNTLFHASVTSHQKTKMPIATSAPRIISNIVTHPTSMQQRGKRYDLADCVGSVKRQIDVCASWLVRRIRVQLPKRRPTATNASPNFHSNFFAIRLRRERAR